MQRQYTHIHTSEYNVYIDIYRYICYMSKCENENSYNNNDNNIIVIIIEIIVMI